MNDGMFLQINRQRHLIPEDRLKAALSIQEKERAAGKDPRPLVDILTTRGDLDSTTVRLIRTLGHKGFPDTRGSLSRDDQATLVEGFHAVVESVVMPAPEPAPGPSKTGWPQEVLEAEQDLKNLFGQFVLVAQVGSGGSGTVYRAWDRRVSRYSGLKILHTMEPSALERFTREARIAGNLQHPSIATIYEVGEQEGRYYIAMKYIDGRPIDADPRSIPECLALIRDACRALDYAHKQGIIHRDVKPANLLVDSQDRVYVTDFGIAKQAAHDQTSTLSMTGTIIGTPKYLPPEQARGEAKRADARSDVYSIGATLYTLLAGRAPFPSSNVWETLESVMKRDPPPLTSLNAAVSPELERMVAKAMEKDPANRFTSAGELADELDRILQQRRYTGRYGLVRYLARKWVVAAIAGVIIGGFLHVNADFFFPEEAEAGDGKSPATIKAEARYKNASQKLMEFAAGYTYGDQKNSLNQTPAEARLNSVKLLVLGPMAELQKAQPNHHKSQILMARADYLVGDHASARQRLADVQTNGAKDYRINFMLGLLELEKFLADHPVPLINPEMPGQVFEPQVPDPPDHWASWFDPSKGDAIGPEDADLLAKEILEDQNSAKGLIQFANGNWSSAMIELGKTHPIPVHRKALHRATYLARDWDETLNQGKQPWHTGTKCRECLGAHFAKGLLPEASLADLQSVLKICAGDPATELLVLSCLARRTVARGFDPGSIVDAASKIKLSGQDELRGVIRVAVQRWRALSAVDPDEDYKKALEELTAPTTGVGKLSRIEALIALGARLRLRGGDYKSPLTQAITLTGEFNGSLVSRALRGEAHLRLGVPQDALKEMPGTLTATVEYLRANLVASEAHLRLNHFDEAKKAAKRVLDAMPDHPEALHLWAAALIEEAKASENPAAKALEAVDYLSSALERVPDFIEARYERACALFLIADWAPMSSAHATSSRLTAVSDLDVVLKQLPGLAPAQTVRTHLVELLKKDGPLKGVSK